VAGLVLEIEVYFGKAGQGEGDEMGIGRALRIGVERADGPARPGFLVFQNPRHKKNFVLFYDSKTVHDFFMTVNFGFY
jgi:hypothetical protein